MQHKNYITLVDSIISNIYKEIDTFFDDKEEAEKAMGYLSMRVENLIDNVLSDYDEA